MAQVILKGDRLWFSPRASVGLEQINEDGTGAKGPDPAQWSTEARAARGAISFPTPRLERQVLGPHQDMTVGPGAIAWLLYVLVYVLVTLTLIRIF